MPNMPTLVMMQPPKGKASRPSAGMLMPSTPVSQPVSLTSGRMIQVGSARSGPLLFSKASSLPVRSFAAMSARCCAMSATLFWSACTILALARSCPSSSATRKAMSTDSCWR